MIYYAKATDTQPLLAAALTFLNGRVTLGTRIASRTNEVGQAGSKWRKGVDKMQARDARRAFEQAEEQLRAVLALLETIIEE